MANEFKTTTESQETAGLLKSHLHDASDEARTPAAELEPQAAAERDRVGDDQRAHEDEVTVPEADADGAVDDDADLKSAEAYPDLEDGDL